MNNNNNYIPVGHIIQNVSKIDTFQFLDVKNNFNIIISFKDGTLSNLAGPFGNLMIKDEPLNLNYDNEFKWAIDQAKILLESIKSGKPDKRFTNPIVVNL
jgi:hypothetical protein